jgi:YesN/AraC family two-component response regulator
LSKLIHDRQPVKILDSQLAVDAGLVLPSSQFFLLKTDFLDQPEPAPMPETDSLGRYTYGELLNEAEDIVNRHLMDEVFTVFETMADENMWFLVCLKDAIDKNAASEVRQIREHLAEQCGKAQQEIRERFQLQLQFWASDLEDGIENLHWEFQIMREDMPWVKEKAVMFSEDRAPYLEAPSGKQARQITHLERQVIQSAIDHNFMGCEQAFQQLIMLDGAYFPSSNHVVDRAIERLFEVFAVSGIPMNSMDTPSVNSHVWRKSLHTALTIEDVQSVVKEVLTACQEIVKPSAPPISMRVSEIVDYVDEHIFDPNLCADMICEHFGISLSYLSRIFKEYQDVKLIDYIHKKRIEASKKLLLEETEMLNIQPIAERVGYSSVLTYSRAFKRIEGMTPGSYRRTRKEQEGEPKS